MDRHAILDKPTLGDHIVQLYQDDDFLADIVTEYLKPGLARGEAAIVIATAAHRNAFALELRRAGVDVEKMIAQGQLRLLDAEDTLAAFMRGGMPDWTAFHKVIGGALAELRLHYPSVRAYGEMVDVLWQKAERDAAIRLEEYWNELGKLQTFSLLCAYYMDGLQPDAYAGALQCVCGVHTHFFPAKDTARLDRAVTEASREVMEEPFSRMMLALADRGAASSAMPLGQKALFWLHKNMPLTAEKVLAEVKARY